MSQRYQLPILKPPNSPQRAILDSLAMLSSAKEMNFAESLQIRTHRVIAGRKSLQLVFPIRFPLSPYQKMLHGKQLFRLALAGTFSLENKAEPAIIGQKGSFKDLGEAKPSPAALPLFSRKGEAFSALHSTTTCMITEPLLILLEQ